MIEALLAATPWPPEVDDVDALIAAATTMIEARAPLLAALAGPLPASPELVLRQQAWEARLAAARDRVGLQRMSVGRVLRSYR